MLFYDIFRTGGTFGRGDFENKCVRTYHSFLNTFDMI